MYTIFKAFQPTAPAGLTPRGPCSNTAPSSLRVEFNQPPYLPLPSRSTTYIMTGDMWWFKVYSGINKFINNVT